MQKDEMTRKFTVSWIKLSFKAWGWDSFMQQHEKCVQYSVGFNWLDFSNVNHKLKLSQGKQSNHSLKHYSSMFKMGFST
jgi:hypothetical protein